MQRPVVVFPLPDSPTSPNVSPSSMLKLTSSTALTMVPARKRLLPRAKCLTRCSTSTSGMISGRRARGVRLERDVVKVTARAVSGADRVGGRRFRRAPLESIRTPWIERAAGRQRVEHRYRAFDGVQPLTGAAAGNRLEQRARVGMRGRPE